MQTADRARAAEAVQAAPGLLKDVLQGKWLGHPLHPMLVHLPTALWPAALVFDILSIAGIARRTMFVSASYAILAGLLSAVAAIPAGLADWLDIKPDKPAWKLGVIHMTLNAVVTSLFALNLGLRLNAGRGRSAREAGPLPLAPVTATPMALLALSALGTALLEVSGYLGGRMVYDYGVGIARLSKKRWRSEAIAGRARVPAAAGEGQGG